VLGVGRFRPYPIGDKLGRQGLAAFKALGCKTQRPEVGDRKEPCGEY
jgi:hypothetical protein